MGVNSRAKPTEPQEELPIWWSNEQGRWNFARMLREPARESQETYFFRDLLITFVDLSFFNLCELGNVSTK